MIILRDFIEVSSSDSKKHIIAEMHVDSSSDLPSRDHFANFILEIGSIAHDISTGDFYAMDSTGTWYNQDGSGAYTPASASALSMPKLSKLGAIAEDTEESETNTEDASDTEEPTEEEAEVSEYAEVVRDPEDE